MPSKWNFPSDRLRHVVTLTRDGILEIKQPPGQTVVVRSPLRYVLVPSLIGTDLLFDPEILPAKGPACLPSLNMVVGLGAGNDGVLVGVWPPGEQMARVQVDENSRPREFESFSLDTAGQSFYVAFLDHPGIWHEEQLRDDYLETHTAIAWQRPFDARWIGRFFIDSDGYDFPFYFLSEKQKLWGRYIRGWFEYPVWFDGPQTMVHFEKKFPPRGKLLVYYLDTYRDDSDMLAPVTVMQKSLGDEEAARLLDFEGTTEQVLLEHGNAVCAMTAKIESYFAREPNALPQAEVQQYADDVSTFIRLIRERVFQFDQFAAEMQELLKSEQQKEPSLAVPCNRVTTSCQRFAKSRRPIFRTLPSRRSVAGPTGSRYWRRTPERRTWRAVQGTDPTMPFRGRDTGRPGEKLERRDHPAHGRSGSAGHRVPTTRSHRPTDDRPLPTGPAQAHLVGAVPQVPAEEQSGCEIARQRRVERENCHGRKCCAIRDTSRWAFCCWR